MPTWEIILIIVAVVIAGFVLIVALQPSPFRIARSATMAASPTTVFAQVNDFHNWEGWSPWAKIDPTMTQSYEGAASGTGAKYAWHGKKVGQGRMTILDSRPHDLIVIKLEFLKPFQATNSAEFTFQPEGGQTRVTWSMSGQRNFMLKAFGLFMSMDKMLGREFEKGLAQMKAIAESVGSA